MRFRSLDGLRGFAALLVLLAHSSNNLNLLDGRLGMGGGAVGVMLFFILSGFLMGRLYFGRPTTPDAVGEFFLHRIARVFPLYLIVVFASYWLTTGYEGADILYNVNDRNLWKHLMFLRGVSVLWTIPVEVQFYLFVPVFWLIYRFSPWALVAVMAGLFAYMHASGYPPMYGLKFLLLAKGHYFLAGLAIAVAHAHGLIRRNILWDGLFLAMIPGTFLLLPGVFELVFGFRPTLWEAPYVLLALAALVAAALGSDIAERLFGGSIGRFTGAVSYSLYLLHLPVLHLLLEAEQSVFGGTINPWLTFAVFVALAFWVAHLSFKYVEAPLQQMIRSMSLRGAYVRARTWVEARARG